MPQKFGTIEQVVFLRATPAEVYDALLDPKKHSAFTGSPATTNDKIGVEFKAWDGYISGKNLELVKNKKIVQEWETTAWPKGYPEVETGDHTYPQEERYGAQDGPLQGPRPAGRRLHWWMARVILGAAGRLPQEVD